MNSLPFLKSSLPCWIQKSDLDFAQSIFCHQKEHLQSCHRFCIKGDLCNITQLFMHSVLSDNNVSTRLFIHSNLMNVILCKMISLHSLIVWWSYEYFLKHFGDPDLIFGTSAFVMMICLVYLHAFLYIGSLRGVQFSNHMTLRYCLQVAKVLARPMSQPLPVQGPDPTTWHD